MELTIGLCRLAYVCLLEHAQLFHLCHIHKASVAVWPILKYTCIHEPFTGAHIADNHVSWLVKRSIWET